MSPKARSVFLRELSASKCVKTAAKKSGYSRGWIYEVRQNDASFRFEWEQALDGRRAGSRYGSDWEREEARRLSWRTYQRRRRRALAERPSRVVDLWRAATPMQRWWLERYSLDEIHRMTRYL